MLFWRFLSRVPCLVVRVPVEQQGKAGFTLLETVVALTVILAAVVGPVSLITKSLSAFSFSKNKLIAVNLAQEGIELARLIRENNIACAHASSNEAWPWNSDPAGGPLGRTRVKLDAQNMRPTSDGVRNPCGSAVIMSPVLSRSCSEPLLYQSDPVLANAGTYGYQNGSPTIFSRCIDVVSPPDGPDSDIPAADQMDVISTVTWNDRGRDQSMTLRERFYNWK